MFRVTQWAIDKPLYVWLLVVGALVGGLVGFNSVGRLEDPSFTIKQAVVTTAYPGATAEEVAAEISEPLESAIQQIGEVDWISSRNQPGLSIISIELDMAVRPADVPQLWTELRNNVSDAADNLPPGAQPPFVNDSFGDVYGLYYAVRADGFSDAEQHDIASFLRRELLSVDGVADVEVMGLPEEIIYVHPSPQQTTNLAVPPNAILGAIANSDTLSDSGRAVHDGLRTQLESPSQGDSVRAVEGLTIGFGGQLLNLVDFASVERRRNDQPQQVIRLNGKDAFTIGIAGLSDRNIVDVGRAVEAHLESIDHLIPYGLTLEPIYEQHRVVDETSVSFLQSLALSVSIVIAVLALFMGWRSATVVGISLGLNVIATFFFMWIWEIEVERISLGALIIAMGMLVDNAIVIAESMQVDMRRGLSARKAAGRAGKRLQLPLLGATVIGIMAFSGIGLSQDSTGEFMFSLFAVVAISLILSWIFAVTVTPLLASKLFRQGATDGSDDPYDRWIFRAYGKFLGVALKLRWLVIITLVGITAACYFAFTLVSQQFFPNSNTPIFYANVKFQQGTAISETSEQVRVLEEWLLERQDVSRVTTTVGQGASRFLLTYQPEQQDPSYAQLIVETESLQDIPDLMQALNEVATQALPQARVRTQRIVFGPPAGADVEARISGKNADVLRQIGDDISARLSARPDILQAVRTNWHEREMTVRPEYAQERAQAAGVSRDDAAQALKMATDGIRAGEVREGDRLIPIVVRAPDYSREQPGHLMNQRVYSEAANGYLSLSQVLDGFTLNPRDSLIYHRDRQPTLAVQANAVSGITAADAFSQIRADIEAMELPPGYSLEWGGEYEAQQMANEALAVRLPISILTMVLISILLFGKLRQPLVIWLLVPMAVNGAAIGLLGTGLPFTFTALLGLLSLSGMLIKNGIVLVEEVDLRRDAGDTITPAIVNASISRVRPVLLAATTTALGMIPLLWDPFFESMAVTIMAGLMFASLLTLVAAPVLYYTLFPGARKDERAMTRAELV